MTRFSRFLGGFAFRRAALGAALFGCVLSVAQPAICQEPSARDRAAAGEAFDRGTSLWLSKDYKDAARFFETAHRLAPASGALVQAVRAHLRAKNPMRAATLSLMLQELYPDDKLAAKTAKKGLAKWKKRYARVDVKCEECTIEVDGKIVSYPSFFVVPGEDHEVIASFSTGSENQTVQGEAGETVEVQFEAPPEPEKTPEAAAPEKSAVEAPSAPPPGADERGERILKPTLIPIVLGSATVGMGAVLIWSGKDTLNANDRYEDDPTQARLSNGRDLERRTNILLGVTATLGVAAVTTTVLHFLRKKPKSETAGIRGDVAMNRRGGFVTLGGSFR